MRHLKAGRALGVKSAHRKAMLRNLVTSVVEEERITTTVARAKELRKPLDKMITLGKKGDLNSRRQALAFIKSKQAMAKLFGELAERYKDRDGGFTRIMKMAPRRGDGAEMALVILVGSENDPFEGESRTKRGGSKPAKKKVIEEVAEEVKAAPKAEATEEKPVEKAEVEAETKAEAAPEKAETAEETPAEETEQPKAEAKADTGEGEGKESPAEEKAD